jgi:serine/threonine protein kinase
MKLEPGAVLAGRYRLDEKLGEGGMGVVWSATHRVTRQKVALKLLLPGAGTEANRFVKRFMREARAASAVKHPNVVVVYDVMELDEETPMMVMELLRGETLGQRLDRERVLGLGEVARVLLPVVSALGSAHLAGIVHRDVKPDNIFLETAPEGTCVKVLDFGVAKMAPSFAGDDGAATLTATNSIVGTPYYMAPEQVWGEKDIDYRADIWALGVIAYECLAGVRPAVGDNLGQIMKIITTNRIVPVDQATPGLPADVAGIVMGALRLERNERPSLAEMKVVLARYTDVQVPDFINPLGDTINSKRDVSLRASDSAGPIARTVESGEQSLGTAPTIATDGGLTRAEKPSHVRWSMPVIGGALAAATVLATAAVVMTRSRPAPPPVASTPAALASTVVSATIAPTQVEAPSASTAAPTATAKPPPSTHTKQTSSTPVPTTSATGKSGTNLEHGGVVETVPY